MRLIVVDTNVLVSALHSKKGNEALVLRLALSGPFHIGLSAAILAEYREVLTRPRFKFSRLTLEALFSELQARSRLVNPFHRVEASPDPADNRFSSARRRPTPSF